MKLTRFSFLVSLISCCNFSSTISLTDNLTSSSAPTGSTTHEKLKTTSQSKSSPSTISTEKSTTVSSTTYTTSQETITNTSSTATTTQELDECELRGACEEEGDFLAIGECQNCYCRCAQLQWTKQCCSLDPPSVFDPNAWPNPNTCDTCDHIESLGKCNCTWVSSTTPMSTTSQSRGSSKQILSSPLNLILFFILSIFQLKLM